MKIVDETGNKTVRFGHLKVGHAFEYHNVVWRKIGQTVASPISKHKDETEYFVANDIVIPVDYEITVKSPVKKTVPLTDIPEGGVFKYDGVFWIKFDTPVCKEAGDPKHRLFLNGNHPVEPVDATLTIRDAE